MKKLLLASLFLLGFTPLKALTIPTVNKPGLIIPTPDGRLQYITQISSTSVGFLIDVSTIGASNGNCFVYNATTLKWEPGSCGSGGGGGGGSGLTYYTGSGFVSVTTAAFPLVKSLSGSGMTTYFIYASSANWTSWSKFSGTATFDQGFNAAGSTMTGSLLFTDNGQLGLPSLRWSDQSGIYNAGGGIVVIGNTATMAHLIGPTYHAPLTPNHVNLGVPSFEWKDLNMKGQFQQINAVEEGGATPKTQWISQYSDNSLPAGPYSMQQLDINKDQVVNGLTNGSFVNSNGDYSWLYHANMDASTKENWGFVAGVHCSSCTGGLLDLDNVTSNGYVVYVNTGGVNIANWVRFNEDPISGRTPTISSGIAYAVSYSSSLVWTVGARGQMRIGGDGRSTAMVNLGTGTISNTALLSVTSGSLTYPLFLIDGSSTSIQNNLKVSSPAFFSSINASSGVFTSSLNVMGMVTSSSVFMAPGASFTYLSVSGSSISFGGNGENTPFVAVFSSPPTVGQHLFAASVSGGFVRFAGGGDNAGSGGSGQGDSFGSHVATMVVNANNFAIIKSSRVSVGTTEYALVTVSSVALASTQFVSLSSGGTEGTDRFFTVSPTSFTVSVSSTIINGTLVINGDKTNVGSPSFIGTNLQIVGGSSLTVMGGGGIDTSSISIRGTQLFRSTWATVNPCNGMTVVYDTGSIATAATITYSASQFGGTSICGPKAGMIENVNTTTAGPRVKSLSGLPSSFTIYNPDVINTQFYWVEFWIK